MIMLTVTTWVDLNHGPLPYQHRAGTGRDMIRRTSKAIRAGADTHATAPLRASLMLAQGTPLHMVFEILDHASIVITRDVYGHLVEGDKRSAADGAPEASFPSADQRSMPGNSFAKTV